jgi:AhpD family alkylhydroperoxidase
MQPRINYSAASPELIQAMMGLETYLRGCGLEPALLELVKLRASQINGCAYCIDMHTKDARAAGETEQRIYALNAWRETPFFSDRERAALAWTEAVTRIGEGVGDALFAEASGQFSEKELADLTWAVAAINAWNRVAISFRSVPGVVVPFLSAGRVEKHLQALCHLADLLDRPADRLRGTIQVQDQAIPQTVC